MDVAFFGHGFSWLYAIVNMQHAYMNVLPVLLVMRALVSRCFVVTNQENINVIYGKMKDDASPSAGVWCMRTHELRHAVSVHRPRGDTSVPREVSFFDWVNPIRVLRILCAYLPRYIVYTDCERCRCLYVYTTIGT